MERFGEILPIRYYSVIMINIRSIIIIGIHARSHRHRFTVNAYSYMIRFSSVGTTSCTLHPSHRRGQNVLKGRSKSQQIKVSCGFFDPVAGYYS